MENDKIRKRKKPTTLLKKFMKSRSGEYFLIKFPVGAAVGAVVGYGKKLFIFASITLLFLLDCYGIKLNQTHLCIIIDVANYFASND